MKLVIKRNKWVNGSNEDDPRGSAELLNSEGNMCCLGFFAKACGFKSKEIKNMCTPGSLYNDRTYSDQAERGFLKKIEKTPFKELLTKDGRNSRLANSLIDINDSSTMKNETREKKITEKLTKIGVKVTFLDK